ncbi:MAG: carboxymuconolactone decarboxylase family protein [Rhodanobacter sp.]
MKKSGLDHPLLELVMMRASQINACAYCLDVRSHGRARRG